MKLLPFALLMASLMLAGGCASSRKEAERQRAVTAVPLLLETDRTFNRHAQERGLGDAFATFAAPNGMLLPPGGPPVIGIEAIRREMSGPGASLVWQPLHAEASRDGSLGWTWGTYEFRGPGPAGQPQIRTGKYLTVWRRMVDGSWKFAADLSNQAP